MTVWMVESGEYEQRGVMFIAASKDAAIRAVKDSYADYKVVWAETDGGLAGTFEELQYLSTKHIAYFDITEWTVKE